MKILIVNVHSARNLGDDAIMQATLHSLRSAYAGASVTVAANDPESFHKYDDLTVIGSFTTWIARLSGRRWQIRRALMVANAALLTLAAAIYRLLGRRFWFGSTNGRRLLAAYYDADLVLSCGGGNFYAYRPFSPFFVWAVLALAFPLGLGKKVVLLPQSVGPIRGRLQVLLARLVLGRVHRIMVREARSAEFVTHHLGLKKPPVVLPDLAFALAASQNIPVEATGGSKTRPFTATGGATARGSAPRIGVTVIDWAAQTGDLGGQKGYEDAIAGLLARLATEYTAQVEVICQSYGPSADHDDRIAARRLYERLQGQVGSITLRDDFDGVRDLQAAYGELDLLIGTRMHSGILALGESVPVLLVGYQPKTEGTLALLGLERYCCDLRSISADRLYALARELLEDGETSRAAIAARVGQVRSQSLNWVRYLEG